MSEAVFSNEANRNPYEVLEAGKPLLSHFGVEVNSLAEPERFIEATKQISPMYKGERTLVRFELEHDQTEWPEKSKAVIASTAEAFDMLLPETPLSGDFDAIIALGGARRAPLDRARYAAAAIAEGRATAQMLFVSGSERLLNKVEQAAVESYAPGAKTAYNLAEAAAQIVADENPGLTVVPFFNAGENVHTVSSVTDIIETLKAQQGVNEHIRIATVTTQIYRLATEFDVSRAVRQAGLISPAVIAGNPSDPAIVANRTPATYLAESIRTLQAAARAL